MRGFLSDQQLSFEVLVEWHAIGEQVADAIRRLARHRVGDGFIHQTGARDDGVARMRFRCIAFGDRRRDAALRPRARRAFAERRGGDDGDRAGRELQRAEQAREPAADDDDVVLCDLIYTASRDSG